MKKKYLVMFSFFTAVFFFLSVSIMAPFSVAVKPAVAFGPGGGGLL